MTDWGLRVRALLDGRFALAVGILVVVVAASGWVTATTHLGDSTVTEQRATTAWESTGGFEHSAMVRNETAIFDRGERLTNRSVYFTRVSPRLDGQFYFTYTVNESGELEPTVDLRLVLRGVQDETELWRTSRQLNSTTRTLQPGERLTVPLSLNISQVVNRSDRIQNQLGGSPGETQILVQANVSLRGTVNGEAVRDNTTYTMPIAVDGNTYSPDGNATTETYQGFRTVSVRRSAGLLAGVGAPALLLVSLVGLVGLVAGHVRDDLGLSRRERALLDYRDERRDFDEWISTVSLPAETLDGPTARAESLGDLVDVAIDTNNSVLEDPEDGNYYVRHDGVLYVYEPPSEDRAAE